MKTISGFSTVMFILMAGFALVRLFYYFKFMRDTRLSEFDKSLWNLKFVSIFLAAIIYVLALYLPSGFYFHIDLERSSQEVALQQVVRNQEEMGEDLTQLYFICFLALITIATYLVSTVTIVNRLQKESRISAAKDVPQLKRPLGL